MLAAGSSVRFGKDKLLLNLQGKPLYRHMLEILESLRKKGRLSHVLVVCQADEIYEDIKKNFQKLEAVINLRPEMGISRSIRLGLEHLLDIAPTSHACLFAVADQPRISSDSIINLLKTWDQNNCGIVSSCYQQRTGNPVIFGAKYYEELINLSGDTGGKQVLKRHEDDVMYCEMPPDELMDIDTKDDLARDSLISYFPFLRNPHHVVSLVGAGGKTTLIYMMARVCALQGMKVIITTTTHMQKPTKYPLATNIDDLCNALKQGDIVVAGKEAGDGKITGWDEMDFKDFMKLADFVLIEADGAKMLPCKVPAGNEPVIPKESDIVLGLMGMNTLGRPLKDVVFRKEKAMELLKTDENHLMNMDDMAFILANSKGTKKDVEKREYFAILNQCDNEIMLKKALKIQMLLYNYGITNTVCISLKQIQS